MRPASVEQTPRRTSLLSEIEHPTAGKVLWMGIGAVLAIALTVVGTAVAKPALSGDEHALANTRAFRDVTRNAARSGWGSTSTPAQPACSRCQVCDPWIG